MIRPFLFFGLIVPSLCFANEGFYKVDHRIALRGAEGWDCLSIDSSSDRLFISRGNHVDVVDIKTEKIVGTISDAINGAHAIAFVPLLNKGYITSGKSGKVVIFDLSNLRVLKEVPAAIGADILLFEPQTQRVFSFNGKDRSVTVIDVKLDTVVGTIRLDGKPEFAVSDFGKIYVNIEDTNSITVIDSKTFTVTNSWPLPGCQGPTGLSADFKSKRLFSVCGNEIMAITDANTGKQIKTLKIGNAPDGSVFDSGLIFSSNGSGTLTVAKEVDPMKFEVIQTLETQKGARTMTLDLKTHTLYLVAAKYEPIDSKNPKVRPKIIEGSVELLVVKK